KGGTHTEEAVHRAEGNDADQVDAEQGVAALAVVAARLPVADLGLEIAGDTVVAGRLVAGVVVAPADADAQRGRVVGLHTARRLDEPGADAEGEAFPVASALVVIAVIAVGGLSLSPPRREQGGQRQRRGHGAACHVILSFRGAGTGGAVHRSQIAVKGSFLGWNRTTREGGRPGFTAPSDFDRPPPHLSDPFQ